MHEIVHFFIPTPSGKPRRKMLVISAIMIMMMMAYGICFGFEEVRQTNRELPSL